jgi:VWFA-related protein
MRMLGQRFGRVWCLIGMLFLIAGYEVPMPGHLLLAQRGAVHLEVVVTDETGTFVRGLAPSHFVVMVDKTKFGVKDLKLESDVTPNDLILLMDTSAIAGQISNPLADIAHSFIAGSGAKDQVALVSYDSSANLLQDFTSSKHLLTEAVRGIKYGNEAALLDALYATADGGYVNSTGRRILVLVSAGIDTGSRSKLKDVAQLLQRRKIFLFAISLGGRRFSGAETSDVFEKLTVATGGRAFYPRKANDIAGIVNQVLGSEGKREYYDLVLDSSPGNLEEAQKKLRVQIDRDRKEDKNLAVTARFAQP